MGGPGMTRADVQIRRIAPSEAAEYRTIRLEALQRDPEAFGATFESENAQPLTWFADRLAGSEVLGAYRDLELMGTAALSVRQGAKEAHKGIVWGVYVRLEARRAGVARLLTEAIIQLARSRVELIQLTVALGNEAAHRMYASLGFLEYGTERNALKQNGRYYDEILMAKSLTPKSD